MAEESSKNTAAPVTEAPAAKATAKTKRGKKNKIVVPTGEAHIQASFNNTIISITDRHGRVLVASSAGANGFRGSKKGTAYAAQVAAEKVAETAKRDHGMNNVDIYVKGIGLGRDSAVRAFSAAGMNINSITDKTPIAHGGCRPKGERKP